MNPRRVLQHRRREFAGVYQVTQRRGGQILPLDAQAAVGTLSELPDLVAQVGHGPAILIIGEAVAHAAPSQAQKSYLQDLSPVISKLLEAAE